MNNFIESSSRIGRMYSDFMKSGKGEMELLAEIDKLTEMLRKEGCAHAGFFDAMLRQGFMHDLINLNKERAVGNPYVYVLHAEDSGLTKIGFSTRVNARVREIASMSGAKLKLLAKVPADRKLEIELHNKYAGYRAHGEWFSLREEHLSELSSLVGNEIRVG